MHKITISGGPFEPYAHLGCRARDVRERQCCQPNLQPTCGVIHGCPPEARTTIYVTILDLRRNSDDDNNTPTTPHARRLDSDKLAQWAGMLSKDKEILLFCPHGRSINNAPVDYLNKIINKARLIPGGFDSRKEAGGATVEKSQSLPRPTR